MARKLEELHVYNRAVRGHMAVSALIKLSTFRNERKLIEQLADAADSVPSNIGEGFGRSDAQFILFLEYARGSANEVRTHLISACHRGCITEATQEAMDIRYAIIGRMLTRLIQHLRRKNTKPPENSKSRKQKPPPTH